MYKQCCGAVQVPGTDTFTVFIKWLLKIILKEKAVEATKQKEERRKKPKPEEQEGMPQRQHCPPEKRCGDRNPECHEKLQKDVA
jgi:hypothetical protein